MISMVLEGLPLHADTEKPHNSCLFGDDQSIKASTGKCKVLGSNLGRSANFFIGIHLCCMVDVFIILISCLYFLCINVNYSYFHKTMCLSLKQKGRWLHHFFFFSHIM